MTRQTKPRARRSNRSMPPPGIDSDAGWLESVTAQPAWLARTRDYYWLHHPLRLFPALPYYLILRERGRPLRWMEITEEYEGLQPFHFEAFFGKRTARERYYETALLRAAREPKLHVASLFGFSDLFMLIAGDRQRGLFLYAGQFCRAPLDAAGLGEAWRAITSRRASAADPEFLHFVRTALKRPMLAADVLSALEEHLRSFGAYVVGSRAEQPGARAYERVLELRRDVFIAHRDAERWISRAIDPEKLWLMPWHLERRFAPWMQEEMRICRVPTTALALMPRLPTGGEFDAAEQLLQAQRVQSACVAMARELPETAAAPLDDYGVTFLTSISERLGEQRRRARLEELGERLCRFVKDEFGVLAAVGIGTTVTPGEPLFESHRSAVAALHLALQLDRRVVFFERSVPAKPATMPEVLRAAEELCAACEHGARRDEQLAQDKFCRMLAVFASGRPDVARTLAALVLERVSRSVAQRHALPDSRLSPLLGELLNELDSTPLLPRIIERFRAGLARLLAASADAHPDRDARLAALLDYLEKHFNESFELAAVARQSGFSVPTFTRAFRRATGASFGAYLRQLRLAHARRLLATTDLRVTDVAEACGFHSVEHFIRTFKRFERRTPLEYRDAERFAR